MQTRGHALFDTAIGPCAIAWGPHGVCAVQLPEATEAATRARLLKYTGRLPAAPPPASVQRVIDAVAALLAGDLRGAQALATVELDESRLPEFARHVYAITRRIPPGQTRSYGEIAAELGNKNLARAVGRALGANPFAPVVPCHRVLAAGGRSGGFSAFGGARTKLHMLEIEAAAAGGSADSLFR